MLNLSREHKAILVSLLFHSLALTVFSGLFLVGQVQESGEEPYLELELAEEGGGGGGGMALGSQEQVAGSDEFSPDEGRVSETYQADPSDPSPPRRMTRAVRPADGVSSSQGESGSYASGGTASGSGTGTGAGQGRGSGAGSGAGQGSCSAPPGGIIPPSIVSSPKPPYPAAAREEGREGTVKVKIQILTEGLPGTVEVAVSSGYGDFDAAAVAVVKKWRFTPAKDRSTGQAIVSYIRRDVVFDLRN